MKSPLSILQAVLGIFIGTIAMASGVEEGITLRLLACEVTKAPIEVVVATKDSSSVVEVPSASFSPPVAVGARVLEIKAADGGELLCSITLPEEGRSFALILPPTEHDGSAPVMVRLDDEEFRPGDFQFINHTSKTVVVKLGGAEVVAETNGNAKGRPTEAIDKRYYLVTMSTRGDSADKVFASTRWPVDESKRCYIVFLAGPGGRVTYRSIDESVMKP